MSSPSEPESFRVTPYRETFAIYVPREACPEVSAHLRRLGLTCGKRRKPGSTRHLLIFAARIAPGSSAVVHHAVEQFLQEKVDTIVSSLLAADSDWAADEFAALEDDSPVVGEPATAQVPA